MNNYNKKTRPTVNNRFLIVNKKSIYFPHWHRAGIIHILDFFDAEKNCFLSFNSLCERCNTKLNFLQYYSILSAIPHSWKKLLKSNDLPHIVPLDSISDSLTCKALYEKLLSLEKLPPSTAEKKLIEHGLEKNDLSKVYLLPFNVTKETKMMMFQYKIIHRILPTNSLLHKMKKVDSPTCPFCPSEIHTIWHLFIECTQASSFWVEFQDWYSVHSGKKVHLSNLDVLYGIFRSSRYCLALNHLIIIGKYYLYAKASTKDKFQFSEFISLVRDKLMLEKYIATKSAEQDKYIKKWDYLQNI